MKIFIDYYIGNFIRLTQEIQTVKNRQHLLPALSLFVPKDYFLFTTVIILIILVIGMFDDSNANIHHIGCPVALDEQFCRKQYS